jgi:Ca-activated chloride channel family protein
MNVHDMTFELTNKWVFFLAPLPIVIYLLLPALRKRRSALLTPSFERMTELSGEHPRSRAWISKRNAFQWITLILTWLFLLAAASGPQLVGKPDKKIKTVRSFMVAADISFSMNERDWVVNGKSQSRWDAVKVLMKEFVRERKSDQIGLIFFGTHAYLQAPLTTDLESIEWFLDQSEVGMAGQMTSLGEAIGFGLKVFKEDTIKQKVMLLLTDGVDTGEDIAPLDAAQMARQDSILIYTLGIGSAKPSTYTLDEQMLKDIAAVTGGKYFHAKDESQLKKVYAELNKLEPVQYEEESYKPTVPLYYYPLAVAVLLGLGFHLLRSIRSIIWSS